MANTYTQIYIHLIFAVKYRASLIPRKHKAEFQKYITGVITNAKNKLIAIENEPDHIHILIGQRPDTSLSDLVRDIKANSSRWINEREWMPFEFRWQEGFGAFSYSRSQLSNVIAYIRNQEEHHKRQSFLEEYAALLEAFGIEYDPRFIFRPLE